MSEVDVADIAKALSAIMGGSEVTPVFGGFRLRETETHYVDATLQLFNWRVLTVPKDCPAVVDRHWCFEGRGLPTLIRVAQAVAEWDCADDTEPRGWLKNGQTGELRRHHGE